LREKLADVPNLTEEMIDSLAVRYLEDLKAGSGPWTVGGFPSYRESKVFLNAYTRMLARDIMDSQLQQPAVESSRVFVNAVCPGLTYTDLARDYIDEKGMDLSTVNTPEQGADTAVWLALLPRESCPMGKILYDRKEGSF
jgi:NAD(P)-dependent dehydrogenase (short-subunit alcohol dehydrogenase family)